MSVCKINGIQDVYKYMFRVGLVFVTIQAKRSPTGFEPHQATLSPQTLALHLVLPPKVGKSLGKINKTAHNFFAQRFRSSLCFSLNLNINDKSRMALYIQAKLSKSDEKIQC